MADRNVLRTELEFIHQKVLGEVDTLVSRLENVSNQVVAAINEQRQVSIAARSELTQAVRLLEDAKNVKAAGGEPARLVDLSQSGRASVSGVIQAAFKGSPEFNEALCRAVSSGVATARTEMLAEFKKEFEKARRTDLENSPKGIDWKLHSLLAAACLLSALVGGSLVFLMARPLLVAKQDQAPRQEGQGMSAENKAATASALPR
jgi:hypothetical protein